MHSISNYEYFSKEYDLESFPARRRVLEQLEKKQLGGGQITLSSPGVMIFVTLSNLFCFVET